MPRGEGDDNLTWKLSQTSVFDVRSDYNLLPGPLIDAFPWKCIWRQRCLNRCLSFYGQLLGVG